MTARPQNNSTLGTGQPHISARQNVEGRTTRERQGSFLPSPTSYCPVLDKAGRSVCLVVVVSTSSRSPSRLLWQQRWPRSLGEFGRREESCARGDRPAPDPRPRTPKLALSVVLFTSLGDLSKIAQRTLRCHPLPILGRSSGAGGILLVGEKEKGPS